MNISYFTPDFGSGRNTFEIYCLGDGSFLKTILEGVVMFTNSGTFGAIISVCALLGVLGVVIGGVINGGRTLDLHKVFLGLIIVFCLFQVTTKVTVTDKYTGYVAVVDRVPLGIALSGFVISQIGREIENSMKLAFQTVDEGTKGKYLEPLQGIMKLRKEAETDVFWDALNREICGASATVCNVDLKRSWSNYIADCYGAAIDVGEAPTSQIFIRDFVESLQYDGEAVTTELYLDPSVPGQTYTCIAAYPPLVNAFDMTKANVQRVLNAQLKTLTSADQATGVEVLGNGLDMLTEGNLSAQNYMKVAVLYPVYLQAMADRSNNTNDTNASVMINQAIEQRNTDWAAGQTIFQSIVRPLMAFIEGFSFAFLPFMAFVVVLGQQGISSALKYFMMLLWIQMWGPCMTIIDLFVSMSASNAMQALQGATAASGASNFAWGSVYVLESINREVQTWMGLGGYLASTVPALAMGVLYGGGNVMSNLAGIQSGKADAQLISPPLANSPPVSKFGSSYDGGTVPGQGAASGMPDLKIDMKGGVGKATESAHQAAVTARQDFGKDISYAIQRGRVTADQLSNVGGYAEQQTAQKTKSAVVATNFATTIGDQYQLGSDERRQLAGAAMVTMGAQASGNLSGDMAKAALTATTVKILESAGKQVARKAVAGAAGVASSAFLTPVGGAAVALVVDAAMGAALDGGTMDGIAGAIANAGSGKGADANAGDTTKTSAFQKRGGLGGALGVTANGSVSGVEGQSVGSSVTSGSGGSSTRGSSGSNGTQATHTSGGTANLTRTQAETTTGSTSESGSDSLKESAGRVVQASRSYNTAAKAEKSLGASFGMDAVAMAQNIAMRPDLQKATDGLWSTYKGSVGVNDSAQVAQLEKNIGDKARWYQDMYHLSPGAAQNTARLVELSNKSSGGNMSAQAALGGVVNNLTGMTSVQGINVDENSGVKTQAHKAELAAVNAATEAEAGAGKNPTPVVANAQRAFGDATGIVDEQYKKMGDEVRIEKAKGQSAAAIDMAGQYARNLERYSSGPSNYAADSLNALSDGNSFALRESPALAAEKQRGLTTGQRYMFSAAMQEDPSSPGASKLMESGLATVRDELKGVDPKVANEFIENYQNGLRKTMQDMAGGGQMDGFLIDVRNFNKQIETYKDSSKVLEKLGNK